MDVKKTFLNGFIEEEVYIKQPQGFEVEDIWTHVCKLKKDLYGLKKAPRTWYGRIDSFLRAWALPKVKMTLTFNLSLWMMNLAYYCFMRLIYF